MLFQKAYISVKYFNNCIFKCLVGFIKKEKISLVVRAYIIYNISDDLRNWRKNFD